MTPCDDIRERIEREAKDGAQPGDPEIAAHRRDCAACRSYAALIRATNAALAADDPPSPIPADPKAFRRVLRRRAFGELAWTAGLIAANVGLFLTGERSCILGAIGLTLAVLPMRWRKWRRESAEHALDLDPSVDFFARMIEDARSRYLRAIFSGVLDLTIAFLFGVIVPFVPRPMTTGSVAMFFLLLAMINFLWTAPRWRRHLHVLEAGVRPVAGEAK